MGLAGTVSREINAPTQKLTTDVYNLWLRQKGDMPMPQHKHMGAGTLKDSTPFIYLVDILDDGEDYRFRFMGSAIAKSIGTDVTGKCMSEDPNHRGSWRREVYKLVYKRAAPTFTQVSLQDFDRGHVMTESVILPIADSENNFSMLLCAATQLDTTNS